MGTSQPYQLPKLPFDYSDLWPLLTEEQIRLHYERHHQSYVDQANQVHKQLALARDHQQEVNLAALSKSLCFNVSGHVLHSLFWQNLEPKDHQPLPKNLKTIIEKKFISFDNFKKEFINLALKVEGSGWAALSYDNNTDNLIINQIEKHNLNLVPEHKILLVIDVWEHAYYLDYNHRRDHYLYAIWEIINWQTVAKRLKRNTK